MRKRQISAAFLCLALLLSLCACGHQSVEPEPTQTVTPPPVTTDTPTPPVETPEGRQLIASDSDGNIHLFVEADGTLFMEWGTLCGPVYLCPDLTNYYDPPAEWNAEQLFFYIHGGYEQDGIFCVPFVLDSESQLLLSGRLHWHENQGTWSCKIPDIEIPDEPEEPEDFLLPIYSNTMTGGYTDLYAITEGGTLLMWGRPEFSYGLSGGELGREPVVLMENAAAVYTSFRGAILAADRDGTLWQFDVLEDDPYEPVWIMDDVAMVSTGFLRTLIVTRDGTLYEWEFSNRNTQRQVEIPVPVVYAAPGPGYSCLAVSADGALWEWDHGPNGFAPAVKEENINWQQYRYGLNSDDSLTAWDRTISQVVQATYCWALQENGALWHTGDESRQDPSRIVMDSVTQFGVSEHGLLIHKEDDTYWYADFTQDNYGYYQSQPLEFICVYDPAPLLPIYPHTMDAGVDNDLYAVLDDGRLVMWGGEHYLKGGTFEDGPVVLMENVASVYATGAGSGLNPSVVAIDRNGTLWGLHGTLCYLNPDYTWENRNTWEYPIRLMDNVAMIAGATFYDYILKRDGTLYHWGVWEGYPGFYNHAWADPDHPGKPEEESLTKIMDNVIYVACGGDGGWAITADHVLWEWDTSHEIRKAAENVEWVFGFFGGDYLTTDGVYIDRNFLYEQGERTELEPTILENVVQAVPDFSGAFIVLEDGSLLQRISYDDILATDRIMGDVAQIAAFDSGYGVLIRKTDGTYWYAEVTARSPDKLHPVAPQKIYPVEEGLPPAEFAPQTAFSAVLNGTLGYYDVDAGKTMYLHTDSYSIHFQENKHLFIADLAAADLDNDRVSEVILRLNTVISPHASVSGYKVLHYYDGIIYGYAFDQLAFNQLKADGTCSYSISVDDYGWRTLSFSYHGYKFHPFTYRLPGIAGEGMYYVDSNPAPKEEFIESIKQLSKKPDAQWFACDNDGISAVIRLIK